MSMSFSPGTGQNQSISVTAASTSDSILEGQNSIRICNIGSDVAYVSFSEAAATATVSDTPIINGTQVILFKGGTSNFINSVCAGGDATTLLVQTGSGES